MWYSSGFKTCTNFVQPQITEVDIEVRWGCQSSECWLYAFRNVFKCHPFPSRLRHETPTMGAEYFGDKPVKKQMPCNHLKCPPMFELCLNPTLLNELNTDGFSQQLPHHVNQ